MAPGARPDICLLRDGRRRRRGRGGPGHHHRHLPLAEYAQRGSSQPDETMNGNPSLHLWLIPLLPFVGFLLNGLLGRRLPNAVVSAIALLFTAAPLVMVLNIALHFSSLTLPHLEWFTAPWIATGTFRADFDFLLDPLSLVILLIVTGVGFLI